ncbi:MAG: ribonuclease D [Lysobacteraceae bacterium]|nr:MAG: ribonuclease D [Xanthomonadaceae bacterium]
MTRLITDPAALQALSASPPAAIGLDTEFVRERTYWPQLALVQIAIGDVHDVGVDAEPSILLIDPLAPGMCEALAAVLADTRILKIMHSASEDLVALGHACKALPRPLFDTQIAAALCGIGAGLGYQRLLQDMLGIIVDKGETRSDWLRRPLSDAQLRYAADDVRHLAAAHDALAARLRALDRSHWLDEDCARMLDNAAREEGDPWPHLGQRATQFLDRDGQIRLLRLLRWREGYARDRDRPRSWILDNELAHLLARTPPRDESALQALLEAHPKAPRKLDGQIWQALRTPLPDEDQAPSPRGDDRDRQAYKRLQQAVAARSAELGLPDGVLASRRWIEALMDGSDWPGALSGWRRGQLESALAPLLDLPTGDV